MINGLSLLLMTCGYFGADNLAGPASAVQSPPCTAQSTGVWTGTCTQCGRQTTPRGTKPTQKKCTAAKKGGGFCGGTIVWQKRDEQSERSTGVWKGTCTKCGKEVTHRGTKPTQKKCTAAKKGGGFCGGTLIWQKSD